MLHATVRNRKIYVKNPTTIPCGCQNVDALLLDLDEEWDEMAAIVCSFFNTHTKEVLKKKIVTTIETTVRVTKTVDGEEKELSSNTTTEVHEEEVETEEAGKDFDAEDVTTEETTVEDDDAGTKTVTTIKTTKKTEAPVTLTQEEETDCGNLLVEDKKVIVPYECLKNVGQMSISLVGQNAEGEKVMTTVKPDSFWDVVESGKTASEEAKTAVASLYDQVLTSLKEAKAVAQTAAATAENLAQKAENGDFDGRDGTNGEPCTHSWNGTVLTVTSASGTSSADLKGADGVTPVLGEDYFTDRDKQQIVDTVLAALPNLDEVSY